MSRDHAVPSTTPSSSFSNNAHASSSSRPSDLSWNQQLAPDQLDVSLSNDGQSLDSTNDDRQGQQRRQRRRTSWMARWNQSRDADNDHAASEQLLAGPSSRSRTAAGTGDILLDDGEGGSVGYSPPPLPPPSRPSHGIRHANQESRLDANSIESSSDRDPAELLRRTRDGRDLAGLSETRAIPRSTSPSSSSPSFGRSDRDGGVDGYRTSDSEAGPSHFGRGAGGGGIVTPFEAKAIAAVTGAVVTSLLMTPFDVLKVRMQTHTPRVRASPSGGVSASSSAAGASGITPADVCCQTVAPSAASSSSSATVATRSSSSSSTLGSTLLRQRAAESALRVSAPHMVGSGSAVVMAPAGCINPSKWTGIWGETVTLDEAMDRLARQRAKAAMNGTGAITRGGTGGFWSEIGVVMAETGVKGLWKGVGTGLAMSIPSSAIYMLGYDVLLRSLSPYLTPAPAATTLQSQTLPGNIGGNPDASYLTPTPFVAGALARTLSATVISPMELFRTRLQALPQPGQAPPTYASTVASLSALVRQQGAQSLWRGLGPTLWRDVPFSGFYWAAFESLKRFMTGPTIGADPGLGTTFTAGAISGTVAAVLTSPFDILKTRRQVFKPSPACSPAALTHRASTIPLLIHVVKTEGWRALTAGLVPRTAKVAPACGIMIGCYEGVGRWLGEART